MRSSAADRQFFTGWIAAVLLLLTLAGLLTLRITGPLTYDPVAVEALAPTSVDLNNVINLNDERRIQQTFVAAVPNLSHIAVHVRNVRNADPHAVLSVSLLNHEGKTLFTGHTEIGSLREEEVTLVPAFISLQPGLVYTLELRTNGVPGGKDVTVQYEGDARGFPDGEARIVTQGIAGNGETRALTGNIRFQIVRHPTLWVVGNTLQRSAAGWVIAGGGIALLLALYFRRHLLQWWVRLAPPLPMRVLTISWRELVFPGVLALMLAFTVTLPYYTHLDHITTMGDVQRALVYRAVARTALLREGALALWDPYLCGGEPLLANMESAHLDPFFLLVLLGGENVGTRLSVTATLAIGFLGAYLLARQVVRLPRLAALLAAGIFPFAGFQMLAFANGNFAWIPVGWVPWVVYFFLRGTISPHGPRPFPARVYWLLAALCLAFIFLGGSLHMTLYAFLACGFLALFLSLSYRSWRPLAGVVVLLMLFIPLVAIKLLPVAEVQAVAGDFERPPPFVQPWSWLGTMLWDRTQLATPQWTHEATGEHFRWIEYGTYVGILPILLLVIGAAASRRRRLLVGVLGAAVLLLLMTFGEFPWSALHQLPFLYGPLRNPQRARVVWLLFAGILAGYGLTVALRPLRRWRRASTILVATAVAFVLLDMVTLHLPLYPGLFNLEAPVLTRSADFVRQHESYSDYEASGYYKVGYENYRANLGVTDLCMPYMMQRGVHARGVGNSNPATPYFGEAMLTGTGTVQHVAVRENTVRVAFTAESPGWLVLNQNYFPGWRTVPAREIRNERGLVAARITGADHDIEFRYRPRSYTVGRLLTALALLAWAVLIALPWCRTYRLPRSS